MASAETALLKSPSGKHWKPIGAEHHHGINLPLFSLRTKNSCGIGEYSDLIPLITWCSKLGLDVIQLLPLNDTGKDPSPYSAISAFALNPVHLGIEALPNISKHADLQKELLVLKELNSAQRVDSQKVGDLKQGILRKYIQKEKGSLLQKKELFAFINSNPWLLGYALFRSIKEKNRWTNWETWPETLKNISIPSYQALLSEFADENFVHMAVQYFCFKQMEEAKKHATSKGVMLKGDVPILIGRDSADVWVNRSLFRMEYSAGAPPDMYNQDGQSWGFPIYNWKDMEARQFQWWKERLQTTSHCYHLYRLDHIVGFFRIWAIPLGKTAKEGKFTPSDESIWIEHGRKILKMMLENCPLLPIGEDLGTVPPAVRVCLKELGICGTKVMRWERLWTGDRSFIKKENYPIESMTTLSTHDSETLQQWWHDYPEEATAFANFKKWSYTPKLSIAQRKEILTDSHHTGSLFHINLLQEYLALFPDMIWQKTDDERINIPGKVLKTNWTYRFKPSLEEMMAHEGLAKAFKEIKGK